MPGSPPGLPWTVSSSAPGCLTGIVNQTALAFTGPTAFTFAQSASTSGTCYTLGTTITLSIPVNNSASSISVAWEQSMFNTHGSGSDTGHQNSLPVSTVIFSVLVNSTVIYTNDTSTMKVAGFPDAYWTSVTHETALTTIGHTNIITFKIVTTSTSAAYWFTMGLDNIQIKGANPILKPHDLELIDTNSRQWFNVSDYSGSHMNILYNSATNCAAYGLVQAAGNTCSINDMTIPDAYVNLSGVRLYTVYIGGTEAYVRTFLPNPGATSTCSPCQFLYMDLPSEVVPYVIAVNDLTASFPANSTQVFLLQNVLSNNANLYSTTAATIVTSGYLDAQSQFPMTVQPGSYTLILQNGDNTFKEALNVPSTSETLPVLVQSSTNVVQLGPLSQYSASLGWLCNLGGITASYGDNQDATTKVWITLQQINGSGTTPLYTSVNTGTYGNATFAFTNASISPHLIHVSEASEYDVQFNATTPTGTIPFGSYAVTFGNSHCPGIFPSPLPNALVIPTAVLGLSQLFKSPMAWETLIATVVVTMTAAMFGARLAHIGLLVIGAEIGFFLYIQWFTGSLALFDVIIFLGVLGFAFNKSRRPITIFLPLLIVGSLFALSHLQGGPVPFSPDFLL